jgi:hypothetical protein
MAAKHKTAEKIQETATETPHAAALPERQPGEDPAEPTQKRYAPDPYPIATDSHAGTRLLSRGQYYDKDLGRYAYRKIQIQFDEKPSDSQILDKVKAAGFEWRLEDRAWSMNVPQDRRIETRRDAEQTYQEVSRMLREAKGLGQTKAPF